MKITIFILSFILMSAFSPVFGQQWTLDALEVRWTEEVSRATQAHQGTLSELRRHYLIALLRLEGEARRNENSTQLGLVSAEISRVEENLELLPGRISPDRDLAAMQVNLRTQFFRLQEEHAAQVAFLKQRAIQAANRAAEEAHRLGDRQTGIQFQAWASRLEDRPDVRRALMQDRGTEWARAGASPRVD